MGKKAIGIITIHKIHNFGSVLQTYALWEVLREKGYNVEIIDYSFPNKYHTSPSRKASPVDAKYPKVTLQEKIMKVIYAKSLIKQHRLTDSFLARMDVSLSKEKYSSREQLLASPPQYDVYISGSDQIWNPRYTNGDDVFLLSFAPDHSKKISYASSFGVTSLPKSISVEFSKHLNRYDRISVREDSGVDILNTVFSKDSICVLDPTLLLDARQWESALKINTSSQEKPYIFCYFLNYSFDAFPYAEEFARYIKQKTGYKLIFGGRPPKSCLSNGIDYRVGIGPEDFVSLIHNAKLVITTSFHGTAFAVNLGKPVYSIVNASTGDDRQIAFLKGLGLNARIVEINSPMPVGDFFNTGGIETLRLLEKERKKSKEYLFSSLN